MFTKWRFTLMTGIGLVFILTEACAPTPPPVNPTQAPAATTVPVATTAPVSTTAPAATKAPAATGPTGEIVVAQTLEPTTLDPNWDTLVLIQNIIANMCDPLVQFNDKLEIEPVLAESWEIKDPTTYVFRLRKGVKFHNGQDFTSADVKYSLEWILNKDNKSKLAGYYSYVDQVETPDDYTAIIRTKTPYGPALGSLTVLFITPKATAEKMGRAEFAKHPVCTGAFKFVEWVKDQRVVMEANEQYWRGAPKIKKITWRNIQEDSTRLAELRTGGIDVAIRVPMAQIELLQSDPKLKVLSIPTTRTKWVTLNTWAKPFSDKRVRQALNYAINKEEIVQALYKGNAHITGQPYAPAVFGYNPDVKSYPFDPAKAKALLAEAGYPNGFDAVLDIDEPVHVEPSQVIVQQLAKIGIKAQANVGDSNQLWEKFLAKKMESMYTMHCNSQFADADQCSGLHFDSKRRGLYYNSPETDQMIAEAATAADRNQRKTIYARLASKLNDEAPVIFLWELNDVYGINKRLQWQPRANELILFWNASLTN
jgi:peptide/nickel transport system substrate-binding protein